MTFSMDTDFWRTLKDPKNEVNRLRRKIKQLRKDLERHEKVYKKINMEIQKVISLDSASETAQDEGKQ